MEGGIMRTLAFLAAFLAATLARAEIEVPEQIKTHTVTAVRIVPTGVPEGAKMRGTFEAPTTSYLPCGENVYHLTGPPGKHVLRASGMWVLTKDVAIGVDGATVPVLLDFGWYEYRKTVVIGEGDDDDGPDPPPPPPPARLGVMIIEDAELRTSLPYGQVQSMTLPDIRELAAVFRLVDKDNPGAGLAPWIALAKSYPWLVLHDVASGRVIWQGPVPLTAGAMRTLLNQHKPKDAVQRALEQQADPQATITRPQPTPQPARPQTIFGRIRR
jgi:hypothetical protein